MTPALQTRRYYRIQDAWRQEANQRERLEAAELRAVVTRNRLTRRILKARMRLSKTAAVAA